MRIITGDECGLLKESIPELSRPPSDDAETEPQQSKRKSLALLDQGSDVGVSRLNGIDKMCRSRGVVDLSFCSGVNVDDDNDDDDSGRFRFCALRTNGSLEQWEGTAPNQTKNDKLCGGIYKNLHTVDNIFQTKGEEHANENANENSSSCLGRPIALCTALQYQNFANNSNVHRSSIVACCSSAGVVSLLDSKRMKDGVRAQYNIYSKSSTNAKLGYIKGNFTNRDIATAMAMDYEAKRIVVGGRERAATMMDVETGGTIWKAKNLPHNPQTLLQQPIWSTAIQFLSQTDTAPIGGSTNLLAIGTAYKQLQIYDVRTDATQRRPVLYTPEWDSNKENILDHRITSLCQLDSHRIAVGDSAGYIHALDLRKITNQRGRSVAASVGRFSGPAGSVRQIVKHENLGIIACVGLDRMLRTYDMKTRKQLDCVYLKQRLNCMLFCGDGTWTCEEDIDSVEDAYEQGLAVDANFDDDDEVVDYVDSSGEEMSDDDGENEEIEGASVESEESDGESDSEESDDDDDDNDDDNSGESDQSSVELENEERPKAKRRRS